MKSILNERNCWLTMAFAFGHLVVIWIIAKVYERFRKVKLGWWLWAAVLFGAILPDVDFIVQYAFNIEFHRLFTHSLVFMFLAGLLCYVFFELVKVKEDSKFISLALMIGILSHILIDMFYQPGVALLWPLKYLFSFFGVVSYVPGMLTLGITIEALSNNLIESIFDMGLGVLWIGWLFFRNRIQF